MTPDRRAARPVVISALDVPGGASLLVRDCEDCACAVSAERVFRVADSTSSVVPGDTRQWVSGREIVDLDLGSGYRLLFNPLGHGGAVVVNEAAHEIFRHFRVPATAATPTRGNAGPDDLDVVRHLGELGMIHPAGEPQRPHFAPSQTLTAWLHVTDACNLACPYCYLDKSGEPMDEATGRAAVDAVIRSAVAHGFTAVKLKYAGGEASLNHRLMTTLHAYAGERAAAAGLGLQATMLSNGVALAPALVESLRSAGIGVMISLDGVGDSHDVQRPTVNGRPSYPLVARGIRRLAEGGVPPHLSVTITSRNAPAVAEAVRFALERDLTFSLNLFRDNDCAAAFGDLQYEEQAVIDGMLGAFAVIREFLPRWSVLGAVLDRGQLLEQRQRSCGVGHDYVVIDQRGRVAKCHMEIEKTLGDVFSADPLDLVRTDMTSALNLAVDEKEGCRDCTWRYWCTGGCTVATFRATGRYDIKSPNCNIYRAIYPEALRLEGLRLLKHAEPGGVV